MKKLLLVLAIVSFLMVGCGDDELFGPCTCNDAIEDYINNYGQPEEITKYDSGDYHSWSYAYYCKGFIVTFTWGGAAGCCETSVYTFSPICS